MKERVKYFRKKGSAHDPWWCCQSFMTASGTFSLMCIDNGACDAGLEVREILPVMEYWSELVGEKILELLAPAIKTHLDRVKRSCKTSSTIRQFMMMSGATLIITSVFKRVFCWGCAGERYWRTIYCIISMNHILNHIYWKKDYHFDSRALFVTYTRLYNSQWNEKWCYD